MARFKTIRSVAERNLNMKKQVVVVVTNEIVDMMNKRRQDERRKNYSSTGWFQTEAVL